MIVIDSSVWIEYFTEKSTSIKPTFEMLLKRKADIRIVSIIATEVLMGFKKDKDFQHAKRAMLKVPLIPLFSDSHIRAAALYRTLRRKGVTVRGAVDCLIAQACIENKAALWTLDRDFAQIAKHAKLSLISL